MSDAAWGINPQNLACDCAAGAACTSPGKHPAPKNYEGSNPMVRTDGDLFVVDVDVKPGKNGLESLTALVKRIGRLPPTRTVRTGSGGLHLYYRRPAGVRVPNSVGKLGPGIDVRGDGGYVIGPGARHVSGQLYTLERDLPVAEAPAALLDLVARPALRLVEPAPLSAPAFPPATADELEAARLALEEHGPAVEGHGGDAHTFKAAALLSNDFALTEEEAWPLLYAWNQTCQPPWDDHELAAKMRGGAKYASGVYGCRRRSVAPVAAAKEIFAGWARTEETLPPLLERVRELMRRGVSSDDHVVITNYLRGETGWTAKQLNLPRAVDLQQLAERKQRRQALEAGDLELIDSRAPLATARQFLRSTADAEGFPEIVRWQEAFWRAEGTRYSERGDEQINSDLYGFADGKREVDSNAPLKPDRNLVETIVHALRAASLLDVKSAPAWIDGPREHSAEDILAFKNGLLHLPTRAWLPSTRAFFGLNAVGFDYDAEAPTPAAWLNFLSQLWPGDAESIAALQEIFGLALTGDTSFQKLFLLIGPKRGGKGNIARVLTAMVGLDNVTAPTLNGLGQHFGLESLIGKTLAVISDARLGGRADLGAVVENLLRISGEDTISVPRKHRADWTAKLRTRFLIISNELPNFLDQSGALASRFVVLRLTRSFFGNEDRGLTQRLLQELPGILLWSLAGLDRLRERGHFLQPASALEMVKQLETIASPIKAFIADKCEISPGASIPCSDLFAAWSIWSSEQGRDHVGTVQMLGRNLTAAHPEIRITQPRVNGKQMRHYEGIRLTRTDTRGDPLQLSQEQENEEIRGIAL